MTLPRCLGWLGCTAIILFHAAAVTAEPVSVTGGELTAVGLIASPTFTLTGDGFSVTGGRGDSGFAGPSLCHPCTTGDTVNFDSTFVGSSLGTGPATVGGTSYANVYYGGVLHFVANSVPFAGGSGTVTLTTPFELGSAPPVESFIAGYLMSDMTGAPLFNLTLSGSGIASATYTEGPGGFNFSAVSYSFSSAAAPVPEPATMALVGSALAGLGARHWRNRRRARSSEPL
jgi:hypothetical protein